MSKPWQMARVASRRELPKQRKMLGPVGEQKPGNEGVERCYAHGFGRSKGNASTFFASGQCSTCKHCGYHVCACANPAKPQLVEPTASPPSRVEITITASDDVGEIRKALAKAFADARCVIA